MTDSASSKLRGTRGLGRALWPSLHWEEMSETYELFQQGRRHLASGYAAQATVALEKAKRREPRKASIREALGIAYFRIQRFREAEAEFRAVLEIAPADDYAHFALARSLDKQGRHREATPHYKLARCLRPGREAYRVVDRPAD